MSENSSSWSQIWSEGKLRMLAIGCTCSVLPIASSRSASAAAFIAR